ncbi:hypothetical protein M569_16337 [Genlisea aurea]|uniref:Uncharacterized protein n=1 Tax=Genlisea aurea TaxID=192259 RepID=S8DGI9_9LAMI|nr:hypothetical protein M569_16337 [Genlisea aurea]
MENRFLFKNGAVFSAAESPPVTSFLEAHPGAYTTTRTHSNGSQLLFWERHMNRLSNSFNLLLNHEPRLLFGEGKVDYSNFQLWSRKFMWDSLIRSLVDDSIRKVMMPLLGRLEKKLQEEMAITILLSVNSENLNTLRLTENEATVFSEFVDVYLHIGGYVPPVFGVAENSARLAIVGRGRDFANAKYSDWIR